MLIIIKKLIGRILPLRVENTKGIPLNHQRMILARKQLNEENTRTYSNFEIEFIFHLALGIFGPGNSKMIYLLFLSKIIIKYFVYPTKYLSLNWFILHTFDFKILKSHSFFIYIYDKSQLFGRVLFELLELNNFS